jgi:hypothetical protein
MSSSTTNLSICGIICKASSSMVNILARVDPPKTFKEISLFTQKSPKPAHNEPLQTIPKDPHSMLECPFPKMKMSKRQQRMQIIK